jgi:predicted YcjX-like family ATPase
MVPDAFGAGALDDAPTVHPNAPVSDLPGLDGHRRTWSHSRCELLAGLKGDLSGYWSRRIDDEHRLVHRADEKEAKILKARYHYSD